MPSRAFVLPLIALLSMESSQAFAPPVITSTRPVSSLNLVPEQGRQLVAFSQAYLANKAKESASKASNLSSPRRRSSEEVSNNNAEGGRGRGLLKNVTRLLGVGGETKSLQPPAASHVDDEVVYPIAGFNLVDGYALPMVDHAACSLPKNAIEEPVVGWYNKDGDNVNA